MRRRIFLGKVASSLCALYTLPTMAYSNDLLPQRGTRQPADLKLSLAQWSLHRHFQDGRLKAVDFANISIDTYGIDAVEYVNGFYKDSAADEQFWKSMKERADNAGVKNLLIMIDEEGELGHANEKKRIKAVENHYKWVNAAKTLGCHSIRVNAFGDSDKNTFKSAMIDGLGRLSDYAAKEDINILIENP